jgi:hypothetical protein
MVWSEGNVLAVSYCDLQGMSGDFAVLGLAMRAIGFDVAMPMRRQLSQLVPGVRIWAATKPSSAPVHRHIRLLAEHHLFLQGGDSILWCFGRCTLQMRWQIRADGK